MKCDICGAEGATEYRVADGMRDIIYWRCNSCFDACFRLKTVKKGRDIKCSCCGHVTNGEIWQTNPGIYICLACLIRRHHKMQGIELGILTIKKALGEK